MRDLALLLAPAPIERARPFDGTPVPPFPRLDATPAIPLGRDPGARGQVFDPVARAPLASPESVRPGGGPDARQVVAPPERAVDPDRRPPRPGSFDTRQTRLPDHFQKDRIVAPHVDPDVQVEIGRGASVGVFGDLKTETRVDLRQPARSTPDAAAGLTFQYRFGR